MSVDKPGDKRDARSTGSSKPVDRRAGKDRRQVDASPPGGRERRRNLEPRKPEVVEIDLSLSQWDALNELPVVGKPR